MHKKMKILLLAIYSEGMRTVYEEMGICSIAALLRKNKYDVMLMGKKEEEIDYDKIETFSPDLIGMTMYNSSQKAVYRASERLKQLLPETYICVGGTLPTYYHTELLKEAPAIDMVIRGEGEFAMLNLASCLEMKNDLSTIDGLTYRLNDNIVANRDREPIKDLDLLPAPARDLLVQNNIKIAQISTSRGCMGKCTFCASQLFWKKWRGRSAKNIADEIEHIIKTYKIDAFYFIDGSFEDPDEGCSRLIEIAENILERNLKIYYFANFRAEFVRKSTPKVMELLVKSGLCGVCIGLEGANESDMILYGKSANLEDNFKVIELFQEYDINIEPGFINLNPYSTFEGIRKNIDFLSKYKFLANKAILLNRYNMMKNTALYRKIVKDNLLKEGDFDECGYHFVDSRIEKLVDFITDYVFSIDDKLNNAINKISYYGNDFMTLLAYLKRRISEDNNAILQSIIAEFDNINKENLTKANRIFAEWYHELLNLAENNWDETAGRAISDRKLKNNELIEIANEIDKSKNRMYIRLIRSSPKYSDYFLKIVN
ncbi:MAG: B12-binding domain-containing radical SAM protein [Bacillota bacterium]